MLVGSSSYTKGTGAVQWEKAVANPGVEILQVRQWIYLCRYVDSIN